MKIKMMYCVKCEKATSWYDNGDGYQCKECNTKEAQKQTVSDWKNVAFTQAPNDKRR